MTSHERFEPDTHRLDETARRLHLVPEDRQLINVSGCNVDPTAVEEVLNRHPKVAKAAAIGVPDAGTGEAVKAFIVLTEGGSAEQILGWMRDPATGMARYLVPKHIEFRRYGVSVTRSESPNRSPQNHSGKTPTPHNRESGSGTRSRLPISPAACHSKRDELRSRPSPSTTRR